MRVDFLRNFDGVENALRKHSVYNPRTKVLWQLRGRCTVQYEVARCNIVAYAVTQFTRKTTQFKCTEIAFADRINEENYFIYSLRQYCCCEAFSIYDLYRHAGQVAQNCGLAKSAGLGLDTSHVLLCSFSSRPTGSRPATKLEVHSVQ